MKAEKQYKVLQADLIQPKRYGSKLGFVDYRLQAASQTNLIKSIQKKENKTGFPDDLKSGIENLSGYSMDDVKTLYKSNKPAQLQALAYAQGTDIHIAPGQEQHLPHEAWHVIQQKQGRVQPTTQMREFSINDNKGLETEADMMGGRIMQRKITNNGQVMQRIPRNPVILPRLWNNTPSTFTTQNTENNLGNSHYIVTQAGFSRLARVNLDPDRNARDQVAQVEANRHMCFGNAVVANAFWTAYFDGDRIYVYPGAGNMRRICFGNFPDVDYWIRLTPIEGLCVIDFTLNQITNTIESFHQGHNVYEIPAPPRQHLTTDDL